MTSVTLQIFKNPKKSNDCNYLLIILKIDSLKLLTINFKRLLQLEKCSWIKN